MKKLLFFLFCISLPGVFRAEGQIIVNEGDDLIQAITDAPDGAEIIVMPGIHVANEAEIGIDKSLTIRGETGGPKPVVYIQELGISGTDVNITVEGIEFSGATIDTLTFIEDTVTLMGDYLLNLTDTFISAGELIIRDCIVRNLTRSIIRGDRADNTVGSILVDDCIIFDLRGGSSYGPFRLKSKILFDELTLQNSTFHHIQGPLINCQDMVEHSTNIEVNHCTLYKWGGVINNKYLFDIQDNSAANLKILNSILAQTNNDATTDVFGFRIDTVAYKEMSFCVMTPDFSVDDHGFGDVEWSAADFTYEDYDVDFVFPDTSNFSIPLGNDLYEMSDEGTLIGDPRWSLIEEPDAIGDLLNSSRFNVYPVPASDHVYLMNGGNGLVEIFNPLGVKIDEVHLKNASIYPLDVSNYQKGTYILQLNRNTIRRIVVQ